MNKKRIAGMSFQTLKRISIYIQYLEKEKEKNRQFISTPIMASDLGYSEISIKKDLNQVLTIKGKPKIGHNIDSLIKELKSYLGYDNTTTAVLVGAGKLGRALLGYKGFKKDNVEIAVAFDKDPELIGQEINGIKIVDIEKLESLCSRLQIHIGIITTNEENSQEICDRLVKSGIKAIWNFAPINLKVPSDVIIQNENLVSNLVILSKKLSDTMK